ncbi:hypothetical protein DHODJN_26085 [Methylorubrum extorquens]
MLVCIAYLASLALVLELVHRAPEIEEANEFT